MNTHQQMQHHRPAYLKDRLEKVKEGYTNMPDDVKALKSLKILTSVKDTK